MQLRRLIRDEKEEVERREGMEGGEEGEDAEVGKSSGVGTPGHATPMHASQDLETGSTSGLSVTKPSRSGSKSPLREATLATEENEKASQEAEDADMAEDGEVETEPDVVAAPPEGLVADEGERERVQGDGIGTVEQMDTS